MEVSILIKGSTFRQEEILGNMEDGNDDVDYDYKDVHCTLKRGDHCRTLRTITVLLVN